ncbi:MAG TPA: ATP-binding protein, partial [Bryobacteraceae bacterium]
QSKTAQLGPSDNRYLDVIINSAHFAGTLVDNLLSFSQVGRAKINVRSIDMNALVAEVLRDVQMLEKDRQIAWRVEPLPAAEGDLMMLRLVWQNLIQNAVKYTRSRKEAIVEIRGVELEKEAVYSIRDNGVGFDQAYSDKLFGVFQRLHRMEDYEGTGIGLANVRRIVARHNGRTWAEGEVDKGACFYFSLPRRVRSHAEHA